MIAKVSYSSRSETHLYVDFCNWWHVIDWLIFWFRKPIIYYKVHFCMFVHICSHYLHLHLQGYAYKTKYTQLTSMRWPNHRQMIGNVGNGNGWLSVVGATMARLLVSYVTFTLAVTRRPIVDPPLTHFNCKCCHNPIIVIKSCRPTFKWTYPANTATFKNVGW